MKTIVMVLVLISGSVLAIQVSDPGTICQTKAPATAEIFSHCKEGDVIQVSSSKVKVFCKFNSIVIPIQNEYLCTYRGSKRGVRKRPLSNIEKEVQNEYFSREYGVQSINLEVIK